MIQRIVAMGLLAGLLALGAACGSADPEPTGAAEGEACKSGSDCASALFCLVKGSDTMGTCMQVPTECGDAPKCKDACSDALKKSCGASSMGSACISVGSSITLNCS